MLRISFFQFLEHHIYRVLVSFILFTGFTFIQKIQKSIQILLLFITLIPDEGNQCCVQQFLRFHPEILGRFFSLPFGVCNNCRHQFQDIFFRPYISKWIVMKRLRKVDRIQNLNHIRLIYHFPGFIFDDISIFIATKIVATILSWNWRTIR